MNGTGSKNELAPCVPHKDVKLKQSYSFWVRLTRDKLVLAIGLADDRIC